MFLASRFDPEAALVPPPVHTLTNQVALNPEEVRVAFASDLHLDFHEINDEFFDVVADVMILAGDVVEIKRAHKMHDFWKRVSENWELVLYVPGNHEYYNGSMPKSEYKLREILQQYPNILVLQNQTITFRGVNFIGATMWTDMGKGNPIGLMNAEQFLNDFKCVRMDLNGYRKFKPQDSVSFHLQSKVYIIDQLKKLTGPSVVITHHAPSALSIHPYYKDRHIDNLCYFSDLSDMMLDHPNLKHWIHGHVHNRFDYEIGECRVQCNPRGYPFERPAHLPPYQPGVFEVVS